MKKRRKRILIISAIVLINLIGGFLLHPMHGKSSKGERLERIKKSPNYRNGEFRNLEETETMTGETSTGKMMREMLFGSRKPEVPIPVVKTDIKSIPENENVVIWFGHSSYYMQVEGLAILIDPVFSSNASPVPFTNRVFEGTKAFSADDFNNIDLLIITHDHWDHLDYKTVKKLRPKVKQVICGLGTGAILEGWGYDWNIISEMDWYDEKNLNTEMKITCLPTRHFSGRFFKRNQTLWTAYALETPKRKIFISGDGGYGKHIKEIGDKFGGFDFAVMENGQYNEAWANIHMLPEEVLISAQEMNIKRVLPGHSAKFDISLHHWDEPLISITELNKNYGINLATPKIGEVVNLDDEEQVFEKWWVGLEEE